MAKTTQTKFDATRPFYAAVGATDLAVAYARTAAVDVQTRVAKIDLEPKALADQARTVVVARVDELNKDAKALPGKVNETVADLNETYVDLAARGKDLVARIRNQQSTKDAKAAARTTTSKAKTTTTQTKRAASTAKSSTKATGTAAKKTASASARATKSAAAKTGS